MGAFSNVSADNAADVLASCPQPHIAVRRDASVDVSSALASKAAALHRAGESVVVLGVDAASRDRMRDALRRTHAPQGIACVSVEELCLRILSDERVSAACGRDARVIDANEYDVLLEDLKVSGLKPRRLREMTKFFLKSMSEYVDEADGWLITPEEQMIFALLEENLEARRAVLPCQMAAVAYRGLRDCGIEAPASVFVVDDFGALSKASQRLVLFLASGGLVAAGAFGGAGLAGERYPFYEGFEAYADRSDVAAFDVAVPVRPAPSVEAAATPFEEFSLVADRVVEAVGEGIPASDIVIATPHAVWSRRIAEELRRRAVAVSFCGGPAKAKGDPRDRERCADLKLRAFAKLVRDPDDMTALRSWVGLGDWLMRSDAFTELLAFARAQGMTAREALEAQRALPAGERSLMLFDKIARPLDELDELRAELACADAASAIAALERRGMPVDARCRASMEQAGSSCLDALVSDVLDEGIRAEAESNGVRIGRYEECCGMHARAVFVCGLAGGFLPRLDALDEGYTVDHRNRALERDRRLFEDVCAVGGESVALSRFEYDLIENADALHMRLARVFVKDGARCATVEPSCFLG